MADHRDKPTDPVSEGTEMVVLKDNCSTRQLVSFPGSAKRLSSGSERPNAEVEGYQKIDNIPVHERTRHAIDIRNALYDQNINPSPVTSSSDQIIAIKGWKQLFYKNVLEDQIGVNDSHDIEAIADGRYFLKRPELQFKRRSEGHAKQHHSKTGRESAQVFHSDDLHTERNKQDVETRGNESYFTANYELKFERISELDRRRRPTKPEHTQAFAHGSKCKSNRGAKRHQITHEAKRHQITHEAKRHQVTHGENGEYWRKMFLNKDEITSDKSSSKQEVSEAKHQWYRSKEMRPEYLRSGPPTSRLEFWFIILALIVTIITIILAIFLWKYLIFIFSN